MKEVKPQPQKKVNKVDQLEERMNKSSVFSEDFITRAFAIYGHFLVVHLILMAGMFIIALLLSV